MLLSGIKYPFFFPPEEKYVHSPGMCILFDLLHSKFVLEFSGYFCVVGIFMLAVHGPLSFFCLSLFSNLLSQENQAVIQNYSAISYLAALFLMFAFCVDHLIVCPPGEELQGRRATACLSRPCLGPSAGPGPCGYSVMITGEGEERAQCSRGPHHLSQAKLAHFSLIISFNPHSLTSENPETL